MLKMAKSCFLSTFYAFQNQPLAHLIVLWSRSYHLFNHEIILGDEPIEYYLKNKCESEKQAQRM